VERVILNLSRHQSKPMQIEIELNVQPVLGFKNGVPKSFFLLATA
jgi:hypothetical protein